VNDIDRIGKRPVVLSLSGGKDSAAAALYRTELGVEFTTVFADTGWEAPDTYEYLEEVLEPRFGPIARVVGNHKGATDMPSLIRAREAFPWRRVRFCTQFLKTQPIQRHLAGFDDAVNVTGVRRDESRSRADALEWHDDTHEWGTVWQPLVDWTEADVRQIHKRHDMPLNPLYEKGCNRVGCWPCINARKAEIKLLPRDRIDLIRELEEEVTAAADERHRRKHGTPLEFKRTFFQGRGPGDLGGTRNAMPIDEVVRWARTGKGGRQFEMFDTKAGKACVWGLCG
jgi:3'-phosphoadenosine 5'-phosphosulfate sulfotransferase (PAPS reductase)/FAD synthetase